MKLNINSLPPIHDFTSQDITVTPVPESGPTGYSEVLEAITSVSISPTDSGMSSTFTSGNARIFGEYRDQFVMAMSYTEPQIERDESGDPIRDGSGAVIENSKLPLVQHSVSGWGDVPLPEDTENIWYLYEFKPPSETESSVTLTVSGTMSTHTSSTPPLPTDPVVVTGVPWSASINQAVSWDIDTNVAEFKKYYP